MKIRRIKNFLVKQMVPLTFAVSLMGCGVESSRNQEEVESENYVLEEENLTQEEISESSIEEPLIFDDSLGENSIFFSKIEEGEVSLDDIILTRKERDSADVFNIFLEDHFLRQLDDPEFDSTIQNLNVQKFVDLLSSSIVTNQVVEHQNSSLYVEEANDLNYFPY